MNRPPPSVGHAPPGSAAISPLAQLARSQVFPGLLLALATVTAVVVACAIVPLFALANAGVDLRGGVAGAVHHAAAQGVFVGLLVGKPLGVLAASWLATALLKCELPPAVTWRHLVGGAFLAGIGFTMSLFVDGLAFGGDPTAFAAAKIAVVAASTLAAVVGCLVLSSPDG